MMNTLFMPSHAPTSTIGPPANPEPSTYHSPANIFLQNEVYRLGVVPGLRSRPQGPERDFLTQTWGPIVYCISYEAPDAERLIPEFLDAINNEIVNSIPDTLPGSAEQHRLIQKTYASKAFSDRELYQASDENAVREYFRDWKVFLSFPSIELPTRMRMCLMIDDNVLSYYKEKVDLASAVEKNAYLSMCRVKAVEENFPSSGYGDSGFHMSESYAGWTLLALRSLLEVLHGLSMGKRLGDYHRPGKTYLGNGEWD